MNAPRTLGPRTLGARAVAPIGYGAMQLERLHDDRAAAVGLLRYALDHGVDHIDTAEFYGDGFVNGVIRDAVRPDDDVTIVSKVGADPDPGGRIPLRPAQRPEQLRASVEDNLRTLGVERIDVVNLRRLDTGPGLRAEGDQDVPIADQLEVMIALRDEGLIGGIGVSSVTLEGLRAAVPAGLVCVQNSYSVLSRDDEPLLELCIAEGIAWVPFFPLGSAFAQLPTVGDDPTVREVARRLSVTPSQVGLSWLLGHAPNTLLIPGTASASHLDENLAAGEVTLDDAAVRALDALGRPEESRSGRIDGS